VRWNVVCDRWNITTIEKCGKRGALQTGNPEEKNQYNHSRPPLETQAESRLDEDIEVEREREGQSMLKPPLIPH